MRSLFHIAWFHVAGTCRRNVRRLYIASIILGCLSLAACDSTVTVVIPATTGTATVRPAGTPQTTIDCGAIQNGAGGVAPGNYRASEQCYFQAYGACQPAKLLYTVSGIDTFTEHELTMKPNSGGCNPVDTATYHGCCSSTNQTTTTVYQCVNAVENSGALVIKSCGIEGDVTLP